VNPFFQLSVQILREEKGLLVDQRFERLMLPVSDPLYLNPILEERRFSGLLYFVHILLINKKMSLF